MPVDRNRVSFVGESDVQRPDRQPGFARICTSSVNVNEGRYWRSALVLCSHEQLGRIAEILG